MLKTYFRIIALFTVGNLFALPLAKAQTTPPAASVTVKVDVHESMRAAPFNVDRFATVPPNFKLEVFARVSAVRFMATAPNGDLFVSMPYDGVVRVVRKNENGTQQTFDYASGLARPHDIVFHKIGETQYVYIAEKNKIIRYRYNDGDTRGENKEIIVDNLPDESLSELKGAYGHVLKNIAIDSNHQLYVSIASACNACVEDTQSDPKRGAIYVYDANGGNRRLFAEGIRNAEGLDFVPGTNDLWVVVNARDNVKYPYYDNTGMYGQQVQSFIDNNPPEEFTRVREGGNYGWPFCIPDPREGMDNMPFVNDYEFNRNGAVDCNGMERITKGIAAHSAPLGLLFTQNSNIPEAYRNGALVALHGSWNRSKKTGYKVIYFPWDNQRQMPGNQIDFVGGFLNSDSTEAYSRPVDIAISPQGEVYISDDHASTIYRLTYTGPVTGARQEEMERAITVYPVPSDGEVKIALNDLKSREVRFILTNAQSANVMDVTKPVQAGQNNISLDTKHLPNGVYFLSIISGDTRVVRRVVVQNR